MTRPPTHPFSQIPRDDAKRLDGFQFGWLRYDRRSFADIIQQWQDKTEPNAPAAFVQHQLRLDDALSERDLMRLLTGEAAPTPALTLWLSANIPPEIATPRVFRNRGLSAAAAHNADPSRLVEIDPAAIVEARLARLKEIAAGEHRLEASQPAPPFLDELMDQLCEKAGRDDLDPEATVDNMAKYLHIPADVLRGRSFLPEDEAKAAGNQLADLLGLRGEEFDSFADRAASALTHHPGAAPATALTRLAAAARFLRQQAGLTQTELTRRLGYPSCIAVLALEKGYPAIAATKLAEALVLDGRETAVLEQLTAKAIQELTQPTPGREPTPLEQVVAHFATDGLTMSDYLKAALKQPPLFCQSPATIAGNIESVVKHFAADGLTTSDYLKTALTKPQLFYQSPVTIAANVEGVVERFHADGLTTRDYLKAARIQPNLFYQSPTTLAGNIEGVVAHLAEDGLGTRDYLKVALKQPQLFCQSPATIAGNIEGVVERFRADGLTTRDYLKAALRQPQLFYRSPTTIAGNIALVFDLNDRGIFHPPSNQATKAGQSPAAAHPHATVMAFLLRNPYLMCLEQENYALREVYQQMTDAPQNTKVLLRPRYAVERELMQHLGHDDPTRPVPFGSAVKAGRSMTEKKAGRFVLRALIHSGLIRGQTLPKAPPVSEGWQSGTGLIDQYVGSDRTLDQKIQYFATIKKAELLRSGMDPEAAAAAVFWEWAGLYTGENGKEAWYASPEAVRELAAQGKLKAKATPAPPAPEGWQSGAGLSTEYVVGNQKIDKVIQLFAADKEAELRCSGRDQEEAGAIVFRKWAGVYAPKRGPKAWHASPEAVGELEAQGKLKPRSKRAPPAPEGWRSGNGLSAKYVGGNQKIDKLIQSLAADKEKKLREDLGRSEEAAHATVFQEWAGVYTGENGKEAWYASPEAVRELKTQGVLVSKKQEQAEDVANGDARTHLKSSRPQPQASPAHMTQAERQAQKNDTTSRLI